jgi:3-deoxy-manno-octulosonate cytidylyltransferase (CMP-KDO synthetase)
MQSKRFPGKVMYSIAGIPMIIRTWQQAMKVPDCSVYIASDSMELLASCREYGCEIIKTGAHRNGTERCAQAARILKLADDDHVLNLQADLPCIDPLLLEATFAAIPFYYPHSIITAAVLTEGKPSIDPNLVKVAINSSNMALFFSRQPIMPNSPIWLNHIGIYAMMNYCLQDYAVQEISPIEQQEDLEQLRFLYYGERGIKVLLTHDNCISINVPSDLEKLNIQWPEGQVMGHVI